MPEPWFQHVEAKLQSIRIRSLLGRQFLAEFFGTFILVVRYSKHLWRRLNFANFKLMNRNILVDKTPAPYYLPGGGGTPIETLYGDVPPKWVGF